MSQFETSQTIAAEPERIWSVIADVVHWPDWTPTIHQVEPLDAPYLQPGGRFRIRQPKLPATVWTVSKLNPPFGFSWQARGLGFRTEADHLIARESPGQSRLTLRIVNRGMLAGLVELWSAKLTREYLQTEADSLARRLKTQPSQR